MAMIENEMEKKVYKVEDVQNLLGLGRSKAYEFLVILIIVLKQIVNNLYLKPFPTLQS